MKIWKIIFPAHLSYVNEKSSNLSKDFQTNYTGFSVAVHYNFKFALFSKFLTTLWHLYMKDVKNYSTTFDFL